MNKYSLILKRCSFLYKFALGENLLDKLESFKNNISNFNLKKNINKLYNKLEGLVSSVEVLDEYDSLVKSKLKDIPNTLEGKAQAARLQREIFTKVISELMSSDEVSDITELSDLLDLIKTYNLEIASVYKDLSSDPYTDSENPESLKNERINKEDFYSVLDDVIDLFKELQERIPDLDMEDELFTPNPLTREITEDSIRQNSPEVGKGDQTVNIINKSTPTKRFDKATPNELLLWRSRYHKGREAIKANPELYQKYKEDVRERTYKSKHKHGLEIEKLKLEKQFTKNPIKLKDIETKIKALEELHKSRMKKFEIKRKIGTLQSAITAYNATILGIKTNKSTPIAKELKKQTSFLPEVDATNDIIINFPKINKPVSEITPEDVTDLIIVSQEREKVIDFVQLKQNFSSLATLIIKASIIKARELAIKNMIQTQIVYSDIERVKQKLFSTLQEYQQQYQQQYAGALLNIEREISRLKSNIDELKKIVNINPDIKKNLITYKSFFEKEFKIAQSIFEIYTSQDKSVKEFYKVASPTDITESMVDNIQPTTIVLNGLIDHILQTVKSPDIWDALDDKPKSALGAAMLVLGKATKTLVELLEGVKIEEPQDNGGQSSLGVGLLQQKSVVVDDSSGLTLEQLLSSAGKLADEIDPEVSMYMYDSANVKYLLELLATCRKAMEMEHNEDTKKELSEMTSQLRSITDPEFIRKITGI